MFKKLFVAAAAAAAAVSVPLVGVAGADPPTDPGSNGKGPSGLGAPGTGVREIAKDPDTSVPDQLGIIAGTPGEKLAPGQVIKTFTPGHAPPTEEPTATPTPTPTPTETPPTETPPTETPPPPKDETPPPGDEPPTEEPVPPPNTP
jgi:hypothetical protein